MAKILVIDDEQDLCEILQFNLQHQGYTVETIHSAEEALARLCEQAKDVAALPDLILLDVMMEGMSGFQMAGRMKQLPALAHIPIIFCTAKDSENDTLTGFNLGADDYVTKPFRISEVVARVRAVLKRCEARQQAPTGASVVSDQDTQHALVVDALSIDLDDHRVFVDAQEVCLTHKEYDVLLLLVRHQGRTYSRQEILDKVWPDDVCVLDRTVDVTIARLRKKLGEEYGRCIVARSGFGYMFKS